MAGRSRGRGMAGRSRGRVWQAEAGAGVWQAEAGAGDGRPMQEGQGNGTAEENTEKVKFVDEYGLWLGANSAIVHIVRSGIT